MKKIKKEITFIYTDKLEYQCAEPIANEALKRGYKVKFTDDQFEECEIGFYSQHVNYPKNSKFSCVMLHDLGQQHGKWPCMWKNEFWSQFDLGFLPSKEWVDMWYDSSCYSFVRPRYGCYYAGWPKADDIHNKYFSDECEQIINKYKIDTSKKTVLYAPSCEWDNRQLELNEACKNLNINLLIKQFPWNPNTYKFQYDICNEMAEKSRNIENVYVLDPSINIFNAIHICDLLISEESSTLYEAMMLDKPVIAVTDWLIPDALPKAPRNPDFPYNFAIHIKKAEIRETILNIISDKKYKEQIENYRKENFPNIGSASKNIMDIIDNVLYGANNQVSRIQEKELIKVPKEYKDCVKLRKQAMFHNSIKHKIVGNNRFLLFVWNLLRNIKHSVIKIIK